MARLLAVLVLMTVTAGVVLAGCAESASPPVPTAASAAPAAPPKAAEPTKAPAAPAKATEPTKAPAPTAAPAKKVDYPSKGSTINFIVGYAAGGSTDVSARLLAPFMEKVLGARIQVINKPGAGTQLGLTELAKAKPDGYTIGQAVFPTNLPTYLDPKREAVYSRKDFQAVANYRNQSNTISVRSDSPYKSVKDLVDAAKAGARITVGDANVLSGSNLGLILFEKEAGVNFVKVHLGGGAAGTVALLGGKIDAQSVATAGVAQHIKAGEIRALGLMARERDESLPDIKTFAEQGYKVYLDQLNGVLAPAATPKEIVNLLSAAIKTVVEDEQFRTKMMDMGALPYYLDASQFASTWAEMETVIGPLIALAEEE